MMKKLLISTDCTCDLPEELIEKYDIQLMFFFVFAGTGTFRDRDEITAANVFECMEDGQKVISSAPPIEDYVGYFEKLLRKSEEIIHITISSGCSQSYEHSLEAKARMGENGKRVHIIDSLHLSTGLGHLVVKACAEAAEGRTADEIVKDMEVVRTRISTTFITKDAEYLYINGKIQAWIAKTLKTFRLHPVLTVKNGEIVLKRLIRGNYEKAQMRYVKNELKAIEGIDRNIAFITHAGCTAKELENVKSSVNSVCKFNTLYVTNASATISSNCGPGTVGILYLTKA